jgi:hypothetical protein
MVRLTPDRIDAGPLESRGFSEILCKLSCGHVAKSSIFEYSDS